MKFARSVFKKAEQRGVMFDARTYLELRADGEPASWAHHRAKQAYAGNQKAYRHIRYASCHVH